jgi:hypothetical protein
MLMLDESGGIPRREPSWQPAQAKIAAESSADRWSAKNAAPPMHQSR